MSATDLNQIQNKVFGHFIEFGSQVFFKIACNFSLGQCLTSSGGKTHEKSFGNQIWAQQVKIGPKIEVFCRLLKLGSLFFL